ncbi:helix-turn-helix domain-containing protein [Agromyces sp. ISL-38]|uniref:helix-turn-helix domain-containing protein n=1 Tax=Agromyces sp. ISL-38 TaxID=2819107 RepID=UPI001BEC10F7|nr:helix-turn-helix domain-containing protein [Agromyces sp. ISL-38]MBT2497935.1 helix-turn-helix domain-containing protein [Agromyces sp. ISL-38]
MALRFRNLNVSPDDPVTEWGVEGILAAIDRGGLDDWSKVGVAVEVAPYGPVAADLEEALAIAESGGAAALLRRVLDDARASAEERTVRRLRELARAADLPQQRLAERIGTSRSRLSSYLSGAVTPSAVVITRLEEVARSRQSELA